MKANTLGRRSGVLLTIVSSFWIAAPSCGGQSSHVEGSPARPPDAGGARELSGPARDLELYYASLHAATCDQAERCAREVGPSYASYADCMKDATEETYFWFFGDADYYGDLAQVFEIPDEATRKACVDATRNAPCLAPGWPAECGLRSTRRPPLAEGAPCALGAGWTPIVPCGDGLRCETVGQALPCGACAPYSPAELGGKCGYSDECASGFCEHQTCRPNSERHLEGEACVGNETDNDCYPQLDCVGSVCVRRAKEGEPCENVGAAAQTLPGCVRWLACASAGDGTHVCTKGLLADGEPCHRGDTSTGCLSWCLFPTPDATDGVCGFPARVRGDMPCASYSAGNGDECPRGHYAEKVSSDGGPPSRCVCHPKLSLGVRCETGEQCQTWNCSVGSGTTKVCALPAEQYGVCSSDADCKSGYCEPLEKKCGDPERACSPP